MFITQFCIVRKNRSQNF